MLTLKSYLEGRRKSDFAKLLGISDSYLSQYLSGHRRPGYERMLEIERLTEGKVKVQSWQHIQSDVTACRTGQVQVSQNGKQGAA